MDIIKKIDNMINEVNIDRYESMYPQEDAFFYGKLAGLEEVKELF